MKKIITVGLILTLTLAMGNIAYAAADSTDIPPEKSVDIKATYQEGETVVPPVYSVDVSWGSLEYTYTTDVAKTWNPNTLKFEENSDGTSSWGPKEDGADQITVTNHSNAAVMADFAYAEKNKSGINGIFDKSRIILNAAQENNAADAPKNSAALELNGNLKKSEETSVVGSVTVTINDFKSVGSAYFESGQGLPDPDRFDVYPTTNPDEFTATFICSSRKSGAILFITPNHYNINSFTGNTGTLSTRRDTNPSVVFEPGTYIVTINVKTMTATVTEE